MRINPIGTVKRKMRLQRGTWIVLALAAAGLIYVNTTERVGRIEVLSSPGNPNWEWSQYFIVRGWPFQYLDFQPNARWKGTDFHSSTCMCPERAELRQPRFLHVFSPLNLLGNALVSCGILVALGALMEWRHRERALARPAAVLEHGA